MTAAVREPVVVSEGDYSRARLAELSMSAEGSSVLDSAARALASSLARERMRRAVSQQEHIMVPDMNPPSQTVLTNPPPGYVRELDLIPEVPYFNASVYCNKLNLRFSTWLHHPATMALLRALSTYYREAAHQQPLALVTFVRSGARCVRGYYCHITLHDPLSAWCDSELAPVEQKKRLPPTQAPKAPSLSGRTED